LYCKQLTVHIQCTELWFFLSLRSRSIHTHFFFFVHRDSTTTKTDPVSVASPPSKVVPSSKVSPPSKVSPSSKIVAVEGDLFISLGFHFASYFFSNSIILIFWDEPTVRDFFVNNVKPNWERNHGIKGTLHTLNFSSFPNLLPLDVSNNSFSDTIPHQIANLSRVSELIMNTNNFSGPIPISMTKLATLKILNL